MRMLRRGAITVFLSLVCFLTFLTACEKAQEPSYVHMAVLEGNAYERGLEHGKRFSAEIKSLYTRLLTSSILPFLNREQISIAPILSVYNRPEYRDGTFSYKMLLESGQHLYDNYLPAEVKEEIQGIAAGSGMELEKIIILNTFVDTMMAFRAVVLFIKQIQTPSVTEMEFTGSTGSDSVDNDDDGETDEEGEGTLPGIEPSPFASLVEVPVDASIRIRFEDAVLGGLACLDPRNVDPLGSLEMESRCVREECILPVHLGEESLQREYLNEIARDCISPRVLGDCLEPDCVERPDPGCVDPDSIRIRINDLQFVASDESIQTRLLPWDGTEPSPGRAPESNPHALDCQGPLEVTFTPPGGFEPASEVSILVQAGDLSPIYSPSPFHARFMRDERIAISIRGYAAGTGQEAHVHEVANRGIDDNLTQPPAVSFAVRGSATPDDTPLLAHHFALLDSDLVHEHSALLVHVPDEGHPYVLVTWTGLVWGFSGMNERGFAYTVNTSDSLDSPLVGGILEDILEPENLLKLLENPDLIGLAQVLQDRRLLATGLPAGIAGRELLAGVETVPEALDFLYRSDTTFGWNFLLMDANGSMAGVEMDSGTQDQSAGSGATVADRDGFNYYTPDEDDPINLDVFGRRWASEGPDDLRMASHFLKNTEDMEELTFMGIFSPLPQRRWTGMYYRSVRAHRILGDRIQAKLGTIDVSTAIDILRTPDLVDTRDSMNAAVFDPKNRRLHWAMGVVPATDAEFEAFDLAEALKGVMQ